MKSGSYMDKKKRLWLFVLIVVLAVGVLAYVGYDKVSYSPQTKNEKATPPSESGREPATAGWGSGKGDNGDGCAVNGDCISGFCNACGNCQGNMPSDDYQPKKSCNSDVDCASFDCTTGGGARCCYASFLHGHQCVPPDFFDTLC